MWNLLSSVPDPGPGGGEGGGGGGVSPTPNQGHALLGPKKHTVTCLGLTNKPPTGSHPPPAAHCHPTCEATCSGPSGSTLAHDVSITEFERILVGVACSLLAKSLLQMREREARRKSQGRRASGGCITTKSHGARMCSGKRVSPAGGTGTGSCPVAWHCSFQLTDHDGALPSGRWAAGGWRRVVGGIPTGTVATRRGNRSAPRPAAKYEYGQNAFGGLGIFRLRFS